jgi:serine/threonine protein kinase
VSQLVNYPPSPRQARVWAAEIVSWYWYTISQDNFLMIYWLQLLGVEDLHERNILHADLKPDNIFITYDGHACIGDYGLAVVAKPGREIRCQGYRGTQGYVAPETYRSDSRKCGQHFSKPADIWAFGCIIYDLLSPDAQLVS